MPINPLRGEAKLSLAGNIYVLAVTMESLAELSINMGDPPFEDLYHKLLRGSLGIQRAALQMFVQSGTAGDGKPLKRREAVAAAMRDIALSDLAVWTDAMVPLLQAVTRKPEDADDAGNQVGAQ